MIEIGALVVYDITDIDSFDKVNVWVKELRKYLPIDTPIVIAGNCHFLKYNIGNKCDINNRQIPLEDADA